MVHANALLRGIVSLGFALTPVFSWAVERQDIHIQSSDKGAHNIGLASAAPWDNFTPEMAAREWQLSASEWTRYRDLMQGRARYFAADMPPMMVLAMYAENDEERNHYAEMLAQYERDRADRILKVQRAYDAAMNRLYPNEKIIDLDLLRQQGMLSATSSSIPGVTQPAPDSRTPRIGDTLALFASSDCAECADKIRTLVSRFSIAPVEVYFSGDSEAFKQWLQQSNLQPEWLKQHGVTFARDEGQSQQYQAAPGTAFIVRDRALLEMML